MKMKSPLSPSDIEVLLHCHTCPAPHPRLEAPAVQDAIHTFAKAGMVSWVPGQTAHHGQPYYITTPKGDAFIQALLHTPEPVQTWTVPKAET